MSFYFGFSPHWGVLDMNIIHFRLVVSGRWPFIWKYCINKASVSESKSQLECYIFLNGFTWRWWVGLLPSCGSPPYHWESTCLTYRPTRFEKWPSSKACVMLGNFSKLDNTLTNEPCPQMKTWWVGECFGDAPTWALSNLATTRVFFFMIWFPNV